MKTYQVSFSVRIAFYGVDAETPEEAVDAAWGEMGEALALGCDLAPSYSRPFDLGEIKEMHPDADGTYHI